LRSRRVCQSDIGCLEAFFPHTKCLTSVKLLTNMLDLLTVGPKFTRPTCRVAAAVIDRYLLRAIARPQQQTRRPPLPLFDRWDRQTDGRTDTRSFCDAYRLRCNRVMKFALRPRMQINNIQLQCMWCYARSMYCLLVL